MTHQERMELAIKYAVESGYSIYENYIKTRNRVKTAPKVCIFGLSNLFFNFSPVVFKELFEEMNIVCVSDYDDKNWGKEFLGVICIPPHELAQTKDIVVVITAEEYFAAKATMDEMALESYFIGDCYSSYFDQPRDARWLSTCKNDIIKAYTLLEDQRSKEVFVELVCQKIAPHLATQEFYKLCEPNEYYYKDFIHLTEDECFVDCGAYIGDTVESFLEESGGKYESIFAFEPDKLNYSVARNMIEDRKLERVFLYNCGLSNVNNHTVLELLQPPKDYDDWIIPTELPADSMVSVSVKKIPPDVRMGRLDDLLEGKRVSFIKIDVEGFEEDTLNGATNIIKEQKPKVAICAYHQFHHLWSLIIMLHEIRPDYKLHLRHHSAMGFDTVCYAV